MCGIAGALDLRGTARDAAQREHDLGHMLDRIAHRGPDDAGLFVDPFVAFGTVRLEVVDRAGGGQPMSDDSERFWLVYNGEVYNFPELRERLSARGCVFRSTGDTEVVLQAWMAWGPAAVERLEGAFAFAVYDRRERSVHLVRDRVGKRPLFYRQIGSTLLFASEMKAFLARPEEGFAWDPETLADLFAHWALVDGDTPFRGIRQVKAGSVLRVTAAGTTEARYGEDRPALDAIRPDPVEAARETAWRLDDAVRRRLRGDVEVSVLLSGGLDSATITHLVRQHHKGRLQAFSLGFAREEFDETADQDRLAQWFGLDLHRLVIDDSDMVGAFADAVYHAEVPQFRTALAPMFLLYQRVAAEGIKVVLSGEGADEIFLGYDIFKETRLRARWSALSGEERRAGLRRLYPYLSHFSADNERALEAVFGRASHHPDRLLFSHALRLDNGRFAQRLLSASETAGDRLARAATAAGVAGFAPVARAQWLEIATLLRGYLLSSQGDRMSFAHGVEARNPFLAPDVMTFAATLPEPYHLSLDGCEKQLLKAAFRDVLPAFVIDKPKMPYRAPGAAAFRAGPGQMRGEVAELLSPEALAALGPIEPIMAGRLVEMIKAGTRPISPREDQAFTLLLSLAVLDRDVVRGGRRLASRRARPVRALRRPAFEAA